MLFNLSLLQRFSNTTFPLEVVERFFIDARSPNSQGRSGVYKKLHNKERSVRFVRKGLTYPIYVNEHVNLWTRLIIPLQSASLIEHLAKLKAEAPLCSCLDDCSLPPLCHCTMGSDDHFVLPSNLKTYKYILLS